MRVLVSEGVHPLPQMEATEIEELHLWVGEHRIKPRFRWITPTVDNTAHGRTAQILQPHPEHRKRLLLLLLRVAVRPLRQLLLPTTVLPTPLLPVVVRLLPPPPPPRLGTNFSTPQRVHCICTVDLPTADPTRIPPTLLRGHLWSKSGTGLPSPQQRH